MLTEKMIFSGAGMDMNITTASRASQLAKAIAALNANQNEEAMEILESAIAAAPEMPGLYYGRAIAQARLGLTGEAVASLKHLLAAIPEHQKGKQLLEELKAGSTQEVETLLQQALELFKAGKNLPALRLAEKAYSLGKFVPNLHYFRSICLASLGRYEEALKAAKEEVANNPSHPDAQKRVEELTRAIVKPKREKIPTDKRPWNTSLPYDLMMSIQNALHNYSYKGVPLQKNPFDFAIYPILIWNLKPRTIIEIGSKNGGSALWFGDLMDNFGIDGHVYSLDIVKVTDVTHPRVTFIEGDGRDLAESFSPQFLSGLPRPLLVIEDADHSYQTSKAVLDFFHPYLNPDEYIIIEDGIISDIIKDASYSSGPHKALKQFLSEHQGEYEIDGEYCDFFGYNLTWGTNGYLKKLAKSTSAMASQPQNEAPVAGIDDSEFQELSRSLRPYAKLSEAGLYSIFSLTKHICQQNIPGNFVTCGLTAGSSAALMAAAIKRYTKQPRWVYILLDTTTAQDIRKNQDFLSLISNLRVSDIVRIVEGHADIWPRLSQALGMIAFLDIAGQDDESTKTILENLYDGVSNDGIIQVDDYGASEGCRQAVHEFEASRQLKFDINQIDYTGVWFACPNKFPVNPTLDAALLRDFAADDPVAYGIQSQMSINERFQLYYTLRQLLPESTFPLRFVEIGSFAGSSLFLICQALKRIAPQLQGYAVDPGGHPQLQRVLEHLQNEVTHLRMFSHQALPQLKQIFAQDGPPPFMFIDGDHSYEGVRQDILNYYPLLAPGGMMLFHDYLPPLNEENQEAILFHHGGKEPGIRQACEELMENTYGCELVELPLLYPTDPTQTQAHLPIIPGVFSTIRAYRKPQN